MADMNAAFTRELIIFLEKYTELLEKQLNDVRDTMGAAVNEVMRGIDSISKATSQASSTQQVETLTTLDNQLRTMLMQMMGALSADDVVGQRLEHVVQAIQAMKVGLTYMLLDFSGRFNSAGVQKFKTELMEITLKQFTTEEERDRFNEVLGKLYEKQRKAS